MADPRLGLVQRDGVHDGFGRGRGGQPGAESGDALEDDQMGVLRGGLSTSQVDERGGHRRQTDEDGHLWCVPGHEEWAHRCADGQPGGQRKSTHARLPRGVVQYALQIEGGDEQGSEEGKGQ